MSLGPDHLLSSDLLGLLPLPSARTLLPSPVSPLSLSATLPCLQPQSQIHSRSKIKSPALMKAWWRVALFPQDQLLHVSRSLCFSWDAPGGTRGRAGSAQKTNPLMLWSNLPQDPSRCWPRPGLQRQPFKGKAVTQLDFCTLWEPASFRDWPEGIFCPVCVIIAPRSPEGLPLSLDQARPAQVPPLLPSLFGAEQDPASAPAVTWHS